MSSRARSTRNAPRVEGAIKAAGLARYTADHRRAGGAVGALLTSTQPHSMVTVDAAAALGLDGVFGVLDAGDDPGNDYCASPTGGRADMQVIPRESRFAGEIVGVVIAADHRALRRAIEVIQIHEEPLPAVLDVEAALRPGSPSAHLRYPSNLIETFVEGDSEDEISDALARSAHVFDHTYTIDPSPVGFLEPVAAVAEWIDGVCHVRSTTQSPVRTARVIANALGVDHDRVVLHSVLIGGGFGGKDEMQLEALAALASQSIGGEQVTLEITRAQLSKYRHRHASGIRVRTGVDRDGCFTARALDWTLDAGPYAFHSTELAPSGASLAYVLYHAPVRRVAAEIVATNHTPAGGFRGYGGEQTLFAVEAQVDLIAHALGIDPIDLRRRNMLRAGDRDPIWGWPIESFSLDRCLDLATSLPPPVPDPGDGRLRGRGLAALVNNSSISGPIGADEATARCSIDGRGVVHGEHGIAELGQGTLTAFVGVIQDRFPELRVVMDDTDTARAPEDMGVVASRGAYVSVGAMALAADALAIEAERWVGCPIDSYRIDGMMTERGLVGWNDIGPLVAEATMSAPDNALGAGVQVVDVAVDPHTGIVQVERVTSIHDVGTLLQREVATSQVEGGVVQGIGYALTERAHIDADGITTTLGFLDHLVPTSVDVPDIDALFVTDRPNPHSPIGAKGLAECPIMAMLPAIANAIAAATGTRCDHVPFTAERVMDALESD